MARAKETSQRLDTLLAVVCVVASLILLNLPDRAQVQIAHALSQVIVNPWLETRNYAEDVIRVRAENARLSAAVEALEARLAAVHRARDDARREDQATVAPGFTGPLAPCYVVARTRARLATMIQIRSVDPLAWRPELPVVTEEGLIGRVHTVIDERAAWVELLTDPDMAVGVEFERTAVLGVLRPRAGRFVVELVGRDEDVIPGDRVITSGIAEVRDQPGVDPRDPIPRGLRVGTVRHVAAPSDQVFKIIEVEPLADFRHNETVFVVGVGTIAAADSLGRVGAAAEEAP